MSDHRIIDVKLDERTILWRSADVEQERRVAIFDLLEGNSFRPLSDHDDGYAGPYRIVMSVEEGRLVVSIAADDRRDLETLVLPLSPFRRIVRDYFAICDSYFKAIRASSPSHIETVDMARRAVHNDGAELLIERLAARVEIDHDTARRLFTLICVLHIRQ